MARIAYFGAVKLGTTLLTIDPLHERSGRGVVAGIDQTRAFLERRSPNFLWRHRVWTEEIHPTPSERTKLAVHRALMEEMRDLEGESDDAALRDLVWIDDDGRTTTVAGAESAGSAVEIEVDDFAALGAVAGDYVLILGADFSEVILLSAVDDDPGSITATALENDLAGGETLLLVSVVYPDCRYEGQDPGRAPEFMEDRVRFRKSYEFSSGSQPVWRE